MYELKIRTLRKNQWHDKDEVLLHAAFQLLVDYVEQEKPAKSIDWNSDAEHRRAWNEISLLYRWWKKERSARKDPDARKRPKAPPVIWKDVPGTTLKQRDQPDKKRYAAYYRWLKDCAAIKRKWLQEDQRNLLRLIEIRSRLWT